MPEFVLDHGTAAAGRRLANLGELATGYVEAMFFTSTGNLEDGDLERASLAELSEPAWRMIERNCRVFRFAWDVAAACVPDVAAREEEAGRDFWHTRNSHGVGFWDGDWPDPLDEALSEAARMFPETSLYRGDDGLLYLEGGETC